MATWPFMDSEVSDWDGWEDVQGYLQPHFGHSATSVGFPGAGCHVKGVAHSIPYRMYPELRGILFTI